MIEYEDFSLKIEPRRGEVYPVIVLGSPAGEGRSSFKLPLDPDKIGDILFDLGQTVRGSGPTPLRDVSPGATRTRPQQIGDQLFNALFSGPIRSLLDRSLGMIHERQRGLRIKLHIDPEDPSLAQLASLPWEFLYRKETRDFLNLSRFTPILRYLDVQRPYTPLPLEPPLRILVVISDPFEYAKLDLDRERALIEASWARQEGVQVEFMERATILALQDRLADQPYHVLHYMGHGDFDERTGRGVLVMEDEYGQGAMVDGSTLGVLLRDLPTMRLVFLNACETARVTKETGLDPFAGVAAAMVMAGIPAVVAMQFPISDRAAITFSQRVYPLLARGDPVDAAVAEGRRAIRLSEARTMEWGTPVLFMRAPQGIIFRVSEAQREKVPLPQIPELPEEVDEALEQRLAELYTHGLSAFWLEEWEKAARSFQAIVQVRPDYEDAADKLAAAKRQAKLHALYTEAQAAQEAEDWSGALAALEELAAEAANFQDTAERLQVVRKQKQLADLYAEAQRLYQAQQWQAVINVFGKIQAIEPDYADRDELLPTAVREVAEQERQAKLKESYSRAVREMDARRWQEARQLLLQVQEMEPDFRETERLLARVEAKIAREDAERRQQEQTAALYEQALELVRDQQWQQALTVVEEIQVLDPQFADPEGIVARAQEETERQRRLNALYAQAQAAQEAEDWSGALAVLEGLIAEAADFRDAAALLEMAKKQKQLADLYAEAQYLHQAQQWQAAIDTFAKIAAIEPDYPDPEGLLTAAKREVTALRRQTELNELYNRAIREMDARHWQEARQLLVRVQERGPGFRETERLLARLEAEIEREEIERQRQEQIATLYEQALGLARARQWRQVLMKMEEIQNLDPQFADPEGLAVRAQEEVSREEEEARRQNELAALYAEAVRLLQVGQYQEALEKWGEVRARDPRYPDRKKVQATARKKLAALAKGTPLKRRLPRWAVAAIGGVAVVAIIVVAALLGGGPGGGVAKATSTAAPVAAAVTATPTHTPRPPLPAQTRVPTSTAAPVAAAATATPTDMPLPPSPAQTRVPTDTPLPTVQMRIRVTSSSDWVEVTLLSGVDIVKKRRVEVSGATTRAVMEDRMIRLNQLLQRAQDGYTVAVAEDVAVAGLADDGDLRFQIGMGCLGETTAEVFNLVTDIPILVERFVTEECYPPSHSYFTVDAGALVTVSPPPSPTPLPTPHPGEAYFNQGLTLLGEGKYEQAITQFDQALALGWETAELYHQRGWACHEWQYYEGRCSYEQAIADYTKAIERDPQNARYYGDRAWTYYHLPEVDLAITDLTKAIELDPHKPEHWQLRGGCYLVQGNYQAAIRDCDKAIELDPQHLWAHIIRGQSYEQVGNNAQALSDFNKAVEIAPNDPNPYFHRGLYYGAHGQLEGLVADMTQGILLSPDWPDLYGHRGDAYVQLGQVAEARADYEKFLELTEGNLDYADWRTHVQKWLDEHPE